MRPVVLALPLVLLLVPFAASSSAAVRHATGAGFSVACAFPRVTLTSNLENATWVAQLTGACGASVKRLECVMIGGPATGWSSSFCDAHSADTLWIGPLPGSPGVPQVTHFLFDGTEGRMVMDIG